MILKARCGSLGFGFGWIAVMTLGGATADEPAPPVHTFIVSSPYSCPEAPLSAMVPALPPGVRPVLHQAEAQRLVPCQSEPEGDRTRIWWIARDLQSGRPQTFHLTFEAAAGGPPAAPSAVAVKEIEGGAEITIEGQLFTRYLTASGPKPICYPIIGPTGQPVTRHFPMEQVEGESQDHPHHRSFWFTQDEVNGVDFWGEEEGAGRQLHRSFEALEGGPVFGLIRARNDWVKPDGTKVLEDTREMRVYHVAQGRLFDFDVTLRATEGRVEFGDTKEGTLGLRVASTMRLRGGGGHIENARGQRDDETWGQPAEWCDYYGPVDGETVGVAILNHPTSFRHPTYWQVRNYGLFAANPFGLRHFTGDQTGRGRYTLAEGATITFRHRLFIHRGDTATARVADVYAIYADPPEVEVR